MKTIFDESLRKEIIARINTLNEDSKPAWGKMNIYQMLKHCTEYEELLLEKKQFKRVFLGYFFGKIALKQIIGDDAPLKKNMPTIPEIIIKETHGDIAAEKAKWIAQLEEHAHFKSHKVVHPFFGKVTNEQVGRLSYKHAAHHLSQFNS
jgi:hypothetical protein